MKSNMMDTACWSCRKNLWSREGSASSVRITSHHPVVKRLILQGRNLPDLDPSPMTGSFLSRRP
jgi:hypothetical protein